MTNHHGRRAQQLVEQFAQSLSEAARSHITAAQFRDLEQSIGGLLAHEHDHIADLLEAFARSLRSGADRPELGL
jgi:hypothetical protein